VQPFLSSDGSLWYTLRHPFTGTMHTVHSSDMIHVRGYSHNGYTGISVLQRASETISTARAAQSYSKTYYLNGGQPSGVLKTDEPLTGEVEMTLPDGSKTKVSHREIIRNEWERVHSGPANGQRIAILDKGLNYTPISVSNRDAQFVEQTDLSVQDIARFFGVPLYKLQSGKQSYSSNEQNAIEYVVSTLHPIVEQYEEELSYKLLLPAEFEKGLRVKMNMMAELRGDVTARGTWYKAMREVGAYSADDIRSLEDLPELGHDKGGDIYYGNKNYAPLDEFRSISGGNGGE
jgi:HK97 family phage portal protein